MGTTSLGRKFRGLDWQLEHIAWRGTGLGPDPPLPPVPWILLRFSPLREELGLRREERRRGIGPAEIDADWQGPGEGGGGPLPCPSHDIVLLGLLVDGATHAAILQGALSGQLPLLFCRRTWEGSCVLLPGPPPYLTAQG